jgi:hypothetical protein
MNFAQRRGVKSKGAKANQDTSLAQSRLTIHSLHNNVPRDLFSASITARSSILQFSLKGKQSHKVTAEFFKVEVGCMRGVIQSGFSSSTSSYPEILRRCARKVIALSIAMALLNLSVIVAYGAAAMNSRTASGLIVVDGVVTINGARATSGQTIFAASSITTEKQSETVLNLDNRARLRLDEETAFALESSRSGIFGSLDSGGVRGFVPAGIRAEIKTADASLTPDPTQPAAFTIKVEPCSTTLSVQTGRVEIRAWNSVRYIAAGESFSTAESAPMPPPQQNFSHRKRLGLWLGIGAAIGVLIVVLSGRHHEVQAPAPIGCGVTVGSDIVGGCR